MNLGDVEHQLRAGPPEEDEYRVRPLVLDTGPATPSGRTGGAARALPGALGGLRLGTAGGLVVALLVAAFVVGRLTSGSVGVAGQPVPDSAGLQPAFVSEALRQAYYSGADRRTHWMVCTAGSALTCEDALADQSNTVLGDEEWSKVQPVTAPAGHIVVGAQLDPTVPVAAYLSPADDPSASGAQMTAVSMKPGDTFLDLGQLAPGQYVLSVLIDPSSPMMSGQTAIGIVVR